VSGRSILTLLSRLGLPPVSGAPGVTSFCRYGSANAKNRMIISRAKTTPITTPAEESAEVPLSYGLLMIVAIIFIVN